MTDFFPERTRGDGYYPAAPVISRKEFLEEFAKDYNDGQHLTTIGPTQRGKSRLTLEMLTKVISPQRKVIVLAGKPPHRERTWTAEAAEKMNLRVVESWPPPKVVKRSLADLFSDPRDRDHNGWLLRPRHTMKDVLKDEETLRREFAKAILHAYGSVKQKFITNVDEAHQVQVDLGLKKQCEAGLMRGAPDNAVWSSMQRGRFVSQLCYSAPEHMLFFKDKERANQQRYAEIGGVDSQYFIHLITNLRTKRAPSGGTYSQAAYFRRVSDDVRIVDT